MGGGHSHLTCPSCGGSLSKDFENERVAALRCHVGHRFTEDSLVGAQTEAVESALWNAVRVLREKAMFARHLSARTQNRGLGAGYFNYEELADEAEQQAGLIESLLTGPGVMTSRGTHREASSSADN
jgi:two-component system, chemotaxis family, protein-glutamate methylesterase/glutaminase